MRNQNTVLAIHDGTDLNFSTRPGCAGLQVIGRNQTGKGSLGLHLHATLAVTGTGLPVGVMRLGFEALKPRSEAAQLRRKTRVISVCDREGDCFALFDVQRQRPRVELLVRARHNRVLGKGRPKLFDAMRGGAPDGQPVSSGWPAARSAFVA